VGRIGGSSFTYQDRDRPGFQPCIAVTSARRAGRAVVVAVRAVNRGTAPIDLDNAEQVKVSVAAGGRPVAQDFAVDVNALAGVLPAGRSLTGEYAFAVPARQSQVTVTAGLAVSVDQFAWVGPVSG
jgi:hypothetical protein